MAGSEASPVGRASPNLAEQGYGVLEGFLDRGLVGVLRREVEVALQAPPVAGCERPHNRHVPLRWDHALVGLILEARSRRRAVAAVTGGADLRWISGYVSVKTAGMAALWWHQDWWCWDHTVSFRPAAAQVALLCYLDDTGPDNGALRVPPGSHRRARPLHATLREAHSLGTDVPIDHAVMRDQPNQATVNAQAGDAVVIDYRLLHGTHPNSSSERRDCLMLSFTPCWRELPREIRAHLIQHLAQPNDEERVAGSGWMDELLPRFIGVPGDLELSRLAPRSFANRA